MNILGKRCWFHLDPEKGGLLKEYALDYVASRLVVQWERAEGRRYMLFEGYLDFLEFQNRLSHDLRCFHEVIFGSLRRKPVIDFDLEPSCSISPETLLNILLEKLVEMLPETFVPERDLLVYESVDDTKFGAHIVVDNWCLSDHLDARAFTEKLKAMLPDFMKGMIDGSVNSSTSHLRMLGCSKFGTKRVKRLRRLFKLKGKLIEHKHYEEPRNEKMRANLEMSESLITFASYCKPLPLFRDPLDDPNNINNQDKKIDDEKVEAAIELIHQHPFFKTNEWCYSFDGVKKGYIQMKRLRSSWCSICNKIHDTMGFYLSIVGETERIYFHCWSAIKNHREGAFFLVGELKPDNSQIDNLQEQIDSLAALDNLSKVTSNSQPQDLEFIPVPVSLDQLLSGQQVNFQAHMGSLPPLPSFPSLPTLPIQLQQISHSSTIQFSQAPISLPMISSEASQSSPSQKSKLVLSPTKGVILSPQSAPSFLPGLSPTIPQLQQTFQAPTTLPSLEVAQSPQTQQSIQQGSFHTTPRPGSIHLVISPQTGQTIQAPTSLPIGQSVQIQQQTQFNQQQPVFPSPQPPSYQPHFQRKTSNRKYTYSRSPFGQKGESKQETVENPEFSQFRMVSNQVNHNAISSLATTLDRTGRGSRLNNLKQIPQIDLKQLNF